MISDTSTVSTLELPTSSEIAARAHDIWEEEGCPEGHDLEHWLKAESQIRAEKSRTAQKRHLEEDVLAGGARTAR